VFHPGSQVDIALILEGEQGRGKSTACRILSLGYFTDELADIGSKDAAMQLHGAWIVELPELDAMSRTETSKVKAFLTRRIDRYRAPYGRHVAEHGRQCVFVGTVNHNDWLRDETGGRRFLPVRVGSIDRLSLERDVEQLWAEAVHLQRNGEASFTPSGPLLEQIADHTSERYQGDAWQARIVRYAQTLDSISVADCLTHLGLDTGRWGQSEQTRVAKLLKAAGYVRRRTTNAGVREWRYFKESLGQERPTGT
jgi:predicted P-loop ATPase